MKPYYQDDSCTIYNGDCLEVLKDIDTNSMDAIITDPPYELGFMSKSWDGTGIAYDINLWKQALRVLKPGGYLLSFGGSRTYHRMACAIEDAGFEVRDMIEWIYGSGFPKSLNIGKAVDKIQGNEREDLGVREGATGKRVSKVYGERPCLDDPDYQPHITKGTSEYEGWGTALKPAHEPICMARKPLSEKTVAENVLKWGTGGINIDECRVETTKEDFEGLYRTPSRGGKPGEFNSCEVIQSKPTELGRFPSNLIHDGSDEVVGLFPKSGNGNKGYTPPNNEKTNADSKIYGFATYENMHKSGAHFGDSGSAARFFYCAKSSKAERGEGNNHPCVKPIKLLQYLVKLVTTKDAIVLDPFAGSGSTLIACKNLGRNCIGIECETEYVEIAVKKLTVKRSGQEVLF